MSQIAGERRSCPQQFQSQMTLAPEGPEISLLAPLNRERRHARCSRRTTACKANRSFSVPPGLVDQAANGARYTTTKPGCRFLKPVTLALQPTGLGQALTKGVQMQSDEDQDAQNYVTDDQKVAAMLGPSFNPPDQATNSGVISGQQPSAQGVSQPPDGGYVRSTATPPPTPSSTQSSPPQVAPALKAAMPAVPAGNPSSAMLNYRDALRASLQRRQPPPHAVSAYSDPTSNGVTPMTLKEYAQAGLGGQWRNAGLAEQADNDLTNMPDEATVEAPLQAQRAQLAQPIDPSQKQYRPSVANRIWRGIDAVRRGGVLGAFDPADTGAKGYGDPNRKYDSDTALQAQKVAAVDQELSQAAQRYKAAVERSKLLATERRADAATYKGLSSGATEEETEENNAGRDAETVRHNKVTETNTASNDQSLAASRAATQKTEQQRTAIEGGKLSLDQKRFEFEQALKAVGGEGNDTIRQPIIDDATAAVQKYKDGFEFNPDTGNYNGGGKTVSAAEYIDGMNKISADLDKQLATKKQPPLSLRWKVGPNGQEIPVQGRQASQQVIPAAGAPPAAPPTAAPTQQPKRQPIKTAQSGQQIAADDKVMYKGQQRTVESVDPKTGKVKLKAPS
jgi:hypothetical protein